jgi:pimeloyl-ACP methyl ester carboxylesterase
MPVSPSWETRFVESSNGVRVAAHDFGGSGPLVVLCHATGFCGLAWLPLVEALAGRFRCVAIDLRPHGQTALPAGVSLAWRGMADDLTAVVDELSPGRPVLAIGHSMGGAAIILAETARPGLVERAWTYEPILLEELPPLTGPDSPPIAVAARKRRARFASRREAYRRYASRPPLSRLDPRALAAYVEHGFADEPDGTVSLRCRPEQEAAVFEHHNAGAYELAAELEIPFVVAAGGDEAGPAQRVVAVAERCRHLTLVRYPDLSHFGPLEQPDRLAVDIARFFS